MCCTGDALFTPLNDTEVGIMNCNAHFIDRETEAQETHMARRRTHGWIYQGFMIFVFFLLTARLLPRAWHTHTICYHQARLGPSGSSLHSLLWTVSPGTSLGWDICVGPPEQRCPL